MSQFRTSDLSLAAYFMVNGITFAHSEQEGRRFYFILDGDNEVLTTLKASWFDGTGVVKAQAFSNCLKNLKSLCHAERP